MPEDVEWWWCMRHATPEEGVGCRAADRLGPYPSPEAARDWRATRDAREEGWAEEDERWRG
jgi:hypothetical protein